MFVASSLAAALSGKQFALFEGTILKQCMHANKIICGVYLARDLVVSAYPLYEVDVFSNRLSFHFSVFASVN